MRATHALFAAAFLVLAGCAAHPRPPELLQAQAMYLKASNGPAAQLAPDDLNNAKVALDAAEHAYQEDSDSKAVLDMAYVAEKTARTAEARAIAIMAQRDKAAANAATIDTLSRQKDEAKSELELTRERAADAERQRQADADKHAAELSAAEQQAAVERARAEQERLAREDAERKANEAVQNLTVIAQLREDDRGTVITLAGDVLFVTGQWTLLPSAQDRLNKLADALKQTKHQLIIEGHTDSRGSYEYNQDLSQRRAQAVRDYLASRGVEAERLQVNAYGKTRPLTDNGSSEGRAMNRRVEIVVEGLRTAKAKR